MTGVLGMDGLDVPTSANVAIGIIAVIGSVGGAISGAKVGAKAPRVATQQQIGANREEADRSKREQERAVRFLLRLEIEDNLARVQELWDDIACGTDRHRVLVQQSALKK